jgi:threonine synthase
MQMRGTGVIEENDKVVVISTASGIKFTEEGIKYHQNGGTYSNPHHVIEANLASIEAIL